MSKRIDLLEFHHGETLDIVILAKERDGTVLSDGATAVMSVTISDTEGGVILYEFNSSPQVILDDGPAARFLITLISGAGGDIPNVTEQTDFWYNIWSETSGGAGFKMQAEGVLNLLKSIKPT